MHFSISYFSLLSPIVSNQFFNYFKRVLKFRQQTRAPEKTEHFGPYLKLQTWHLPFTYAEVNFLGQRRLEILAPGIYTPVPRALRQPFINLNFLILLQFLKIGALKLYHQVFLKKRKKYIISLNFLDNTELKRREVDV